MKERNFYCNILGIKTEVFQPNPLASIGNEKGIGDCMIRACCKLLDKDWDTVFKDLQNIAFEKKLIFNHLDVTEDYLRPYNYSMTEIKVKSKCDTVGEFMYNHKYGKYLIGTPRHIVAYIDGVIYDTERGCNNIDMFLTDLMVYYFSVTWLTIIPGARESYYKHNNLIKLNEKEKENYGNNDNH